MLDRPWRWLIAAVLGAIIIGLLNQVGTALGAPEFLGLGRLARFAIYAGLIVALSEVILPTPEKLDRPREPLPPLPPLPSMRNRWPSNRQMDH